MAYFNPSNLLPKMSTTSAREIIGPIAVLLLGLVLWSALEENAAKNLHSISPQIWETLDSFKRTNDVFTILSSTFSTISTIGGIFRLTQSAQLMSERRDVYWLRLKENYISNFGFGVWWKVIGRSSLRSCYYRSYDSAMKLTENRVPSGYSQLFRSKHCLKIKSAHGASRQSQFKEAL
ncbi:hypothetical protein CPB85DRAFT_753698 [Mucidula mucida]|nr:hypothetical protein CPB85DRAFT_753698 [Mucidula mucida]